MEGRCPVAIFTSCNSSSTSRNGLHHFQQLLWRGNRHPFRPTTAAVLPSLQQLHAGPAGGVSYLWLVSWNLSYGRLYDSGGHSRAIWRVPLADHSLQLRLQVPDGQGELDRGVGSLFGFSLKEADPFALQIRPVPRQHLLPCRRRNRILQDVHRFRIPGWPRVCCPHRSDPVGNSAGCRARIHRSAASACDF